MLFLKLVLVNIGSISSALFKSDYNSESLNIVISSAFGGISHAKYLFLIGKHLRDRGHHITYAAPKGNFKFNKLYNYTEYDVGGLYHSTSDLIKSVKMEDWIEQPMKIIPNFFTRIITEQYFASFENYEKLFKMCKVDLVICDFFSTVCLDAARKSSVPIMVGFQGLILGAGNTPYITNKMDSSPTTTELLSYYQRFRQAVIDPLEKFYLYYPMSKQINSIRKKFGVPKNLNPWGAHNEVMKFSNSYIGFEDPRPITSTMKLIGPIIDEKIPQLDEGLQEFLDNHRVIYVAFGSNIALSQNLLQKLMGAMQLVIDNNFADGIIWSLGNTHSQEFPKTYNINDGKIYSTDEILTGSHPYIKTIKWAPQTSILNHPNTKLFISHGGIESSHESIHSGTPVLVIPVFGDQHRNARLIKDRGIGDFVYTLHANTFELFEKIKELIREDNYDLQERVKHIQAISHDRSSAMTTNVKFIEHYAQTAKMCRKSRVPKPFEIPCELEPYMQADSRMSFIAAYHIDILFTLFGIFFTLALISIFAFYRIITLFIKSFIKSKEKRE